MKKIISAFIFLVYCQLGFSQVKVALKGDMGTYLSVCTGCQQHVNGPEMSQKFNTAIVGGRNTDDWFTRFTMEKLGNGNYTFKNEVGQYMSICTNCIVRGTQSDFITFHVTDAALYAQFQLTKLANGKYLIKNAQNGLYVARCNGCSPTATSPNQVAAHAGAGAENADWAQWEIIFL